MEYGEENLLKEAVAQLERVIAAYEGPNISAGPARRRIGHVGMPAYPKGYLKPYGKSPKHGIPMIMDEVMSDLKNRPVVRFQNHGIVPDMIAMERTYLRVPALVVCR